MSDKMTTMTMDRPTDVDTGVEQPLTEEERTGEEPMLVDSLEANMTALGSVQTKTMTAAQSAVGAVSAEGDATVSSSAIGKLDARDATIKQSAAGAVIADGDSTVSQSFSPLIVAHKVDLDNSAAALVVTDEATVTHGWVGFMAGRRVELHEGSRVFMDARAAMILAAVVFGVFGILAVAGFFAARRVGEAMSELARSGRIVDMAGVPKWVGRIVQQRRMAA